MLRRLRPRYEKWADTVLLGLGPVTILCDWGPDTDGRSTFGARLVLGW